MTRARCKLIFSVACFGVLSIFVKGIALRAAEIALYRAVIGGAVLLVYLIATSRLSRLRMRRGALAMMLLSGAAIGFNWIFLFTAYRYTTVALATLAYYFSPTLVVVFSFLLFRESLRLRQILCFLGSTAGLVLIVGLRGGGGSDLTGLLFGLLAALFYTIVVLCNKKAGDADGVSRTWVQLAVATAVLLPYVALSGGFHLGTLDLKGWINLLILGAGFSGVVYALYFSAISVLPGQEAAILSYLDPAVAVLVSVFYLREPITAVQLLGGAMILAFAMCNELGRQK